MKPLGPIANALVSNDFIQEMMWAIALVTSVYLGLKAKNTFFDTWESLKTC